ncbi:DUF3301 domain-containing protein [Aquisalimonas asiatica]|uniref:DUF3301 domain-containing protein n=1 Tax=Aquisalimonas asiatica TaxID=406100 RepID=A0A1H8RUD8_9GAMM|nr:DUF3301 domain-containing protein [Aquisalimonas asiatica]SEO69907.1 Protein of unknown function [Aquisalimonas asiatica]
MTASGLLIAVLILGGVALAWSALMGAQEQARRAAARRCRDLGLQFLDESLVRVRTRPGRSRSGRLGLVHWYRFEFSADGSRRHGGMVTVAGRAVRAIEMEPWPEPGSAEEGG